MTPERRSHLVKQHATRLGFTTCGIADLSPTPHGDALTRWLDDGMAGTMTYMNRQARKRREPAAIVSGATRAVVVTKNYYQPDPPFPAHAGKVAKYARGPDYHETLRPAIDDLAAFVADLGDGEPIARAYIDAGPVPERELAQRAGLGWIGKNTMLIDPQRGSFFFLAAVLTDVDLALDTPFATDRCGTCRRCLDACPTDAFPQERVLDSRRCISYLTIEYKGDIDPELATRFDGWVFGCDVCQDVCPWNEKFATPHHDTRLALDADRGAVDVDRLVAITDAAFQEAWGRTPLARPGPRGMVRNASVVQQQRLREEPPCPTP